MVPVLPLACGIRWQVPTATRLACLPMPRMPRTMRGIQNVQPYMEHSDRPQMAPRCHGAGDLTAVARSAQLGPRWVPLEAATVCQEAGALSLPGPHLTRPLREDTPATRAHTGVAPVPILSRGRPTATKPRFTSNSHLRRPRCVASRPPSATVCRRGSWEAQRGPPGTLAPSGIPLT